MMLNTILKRLEIDDKDGPIPNRWMNNDIKPVEAGRRTWGFWTFHNFCICPPPPDYDEHASLTMNRDSNQFKHFHVYDGQFVDCEWLDLVAGRRCYCGGQFVGYDFCGFEFVAGGLLSS